MIKYKKHLIDILLAIIPFICLLAVWLIIVKYQFIPSWLLYSPLDVWQKIKDIATNGILLKLIQISLTNALIAFFIALLFSMFLGLAIGLNQTIKKIFLPFLSFLYPIPSLAWLPLIIIIFGFQPISIWIIVALSAFFKMVFGIANAIRSVNRNLIWAAKNFGYNKLSLVFKIIIPAAFPQIMASIRIGFGSAWRSLIGAEIIVPMVGGLGSYIVNSQWQFRFDQVLAGILIITLISYTIEKIIFERIEENIMIKYNVLRH